MSKSSSITVIVLALLLFMTEAARPEPADSRAAHQPLVAAEEQSDAEVEDCGDECLMRRTLAAHLDYIYTQGKKH
ncbi:unnamed protein product [Spirodela intermedia]|uniref:Phytosulfokine n=1 Tax=Spirodela intermedia TaxID=51605 RepID=A0A7I8I7D1_SPIIN|nr:unnamed protein product [Spirodela intermedia]CAA6653476.1 unnamed protein product [Spirodela intermedia]